MIRMLKVLENGAAEFYEGAEKIAAVGGKWYWIDLSHPEEKEAFIFDLFGLRNPEGEGRHPGFRRPKLETRNDHRLFVIHGLSGERAVPQVINLYAGENYLVSYHKKGNATIDKVFEEFRNNTKKTAKGVDYLLYRIISQTVDEYFPVFFALGEKINKFDSRSRSYLNPDKADDVFKIRKTLLTMRRSLVPLQEVVRQAMHPEEPEWETEYSVLLGDVYDNLTHLVEMTGFYRDMCEDLMDSITSFNSQEVNHTILILTVITTIFMPLTFIVGIYGMNFRYMPELRWRYGYGAVLLLMAAIAGIMVLWFKRKRWL